MNLKLWKLHHLLFSHFYEKSYYLYLYNLFSCHKELEYKSESLFFDKNSSVIVLMLNFKEKFLEGGRDSVMNISPTSIIDVW
jgi:hypothetical protein